MCTTALGQQVDDWLQCLAMMESILKRMNSVSSANYLLTSYCQPLHGLPLVLWEFLQKAQPDDFTLSVMHFHSSREATSKFS